jgi:hypothetical protein
MGFYDVISAPVMKPLKSAAESAYEDPGSRDLAGESRESLQAAIDLAPNRYAVEAQYRPLYDQLELQSFNRALLGGDGQRGLLDVYTQDIAPRLSTLDREAAAAQREADIADVARLGPQAREAMRAINPEQTALLDALNQQTLGDVQAGYNLPSGLRDVVSQSARSGQAARGLGFGPSDAYAETLAQSESAHQWRNQNLARGMQMAGLNAATQTDPWMAIIGRQATTPSAASGLLGQGQAMGGQSQGIYSRFDPYNPYAQDLFNTNYNAQAARNIAIGNAQAGIASAAVGSL